MALLYCGNFQMFKTKYRVLRPYHMGIYVIEYRFWFSPFWSRLNDEFYLDRDRAIELIHNIIKGHEIVYEYP